MEILSVELDISRQSWPSCVSSDVTSLPDGRQHRRANEIGRHESAGFVPWPPIAAGVLKVFNQTGSKVLLLSEYMLCSPQGIISL